MIVEDVHLAGASTIEWLRFAVRGGTRRLVVGTQRPEGPSLGPAAPLTLGPLALESVAELVGEQRALELHARSGGHPLFLQELANATSADLPTSVREALVRIMLPDRRVPLSRAALEAFAAPDVVNQDVDVTVLTADLSSQGPHLIRVKMVDRRGDSNAAKGA